MRKLAAVKVPAATRRRGVGVVAVALATAAILTGPTVLDAEQDRPAPPSAGQKPAPQKPTEKPAAQTPAKPVPSTPGQPQPPQPATQPPTPADAAQAAATNWAWRCGSASRTAAMECSLDQTVIKTDTRQVVAMFRVRVPGDTREPIGLIQTPLGVYLPAGVEFQIDQDTAVQLQLQMCDGNGCYAGAPISAEVIGRLQSGKMLRLGFQNISREQINVTMPLDGFASAYTAIK